MKTTTLKLLLILSIFFFPDTVSAEDVSKKNYLSVVASGLTLHGFPLSSEIGSQMPRRLVSNGQAIITPGLGLIYQKNEWLYEQMFIRDCFDNKAMATLVGKQWSVSSDPRFKFGFLGGLYVRENPRLCLGDPCRKANDVMWFRFNTPNLFGKDLQIFPIMTAQLNFYQPIAEKIDLHISGSTNIALTQLVIGLRFKLP